MVSGSHSSPNRGSSHLSVTLLSSLSVIREYLALRDGPRRFSRGFTCPDLLRYLPGGGAAFAYGTVTLCGRPFQIVLLAGRFITPMWKALQPRRGKPPRFGLLRFRSPLLTESIFLSFPPVTEMFQFTGLASTRLWIQRRNDSGIPGSTLVCQLPRAYRRLPRPSSPSDAETSPMRP